MRPPLARTTSQQCLNFHAADEPDELLIECIEVMGGHRSLLTSIHVIDHAWNLLYRRFSSRPNLPDKVWAVELALKGEWDAYKSCYNEEAHQGVQTKGGKCQLLSLTCLNELLIVECFY